MTKVFHARLNGRFTNFKHNVSKRKLHKTMQGSNFLRGDLIKTVQELHSTLDMTNILKD